MFEWFACLQHRIDSIISICITTRNEWTVLYLPDLHQEMQIAKMP